VFFGQRFNGINWGMERSGGSGANSSVGTGNTTLIVAKIELQSLQHDLGAGQTL